MAQTFSTKEAAERAIKRFKAQYEPTAEYRVVRARSFSEGFKPGVMVEVISQQGNLLTLI